MEKRELAEVGRHPRQRQLMRSLSVQPEEPKLSSSPYSTRRRRKFPGRSLTESFLRKSELPTRKGSSSDIVESDNQISFPSRTSSLGVDTHDLPRDEVSNHFLWSSNVSEWSNDGVRDSSLPVYAALVERNEDQDGAIDMHLVASQDCIQPIRRRRKEISRFDGLFDKEEDEDATNATRRTAKNQRNDASPMSSPSLVWKLLVKTGKLLCILTFCLLLISLIILGILTFVAYRKAQCHSRRNVLMPIHELQEKLHSSVSGQEIAIQEIVKALKELETQPSSTTPLVLWMVGWTGTGKTHTAYVLKEVFSNISQAHVVIPSLILPGSESVKVYVSSVLSKLDPCALNLIIIDGWDEEHSHLVELLLDELSKKLKLHTFLENEMYQVVIIITGTRGSQVVNNVFLKLRLEGRERSQLQIEDFTNLLPMIEEAKMLGSLAPSFVFVPFLPLEVSHVQECVTFELHKSDWVRERTLTSTQLQEVMNEVKGQLSFIPKGQHIFVATGCKRVQSLLSVALSRLFL